MSSSSWSQDSQGKSGLASPCQALAIAGGVEGGICHFEGRELRNLGGRQGAYFKVKSVLFSYKTSSLGWILKLVVLLSLFLNHVLPLSVIFFPLP